MNQRVHLKGIQQTSLLLVVLMFFAIGWNGCGKKEPSKQGADEFRKEVKRACQEMVPPLVEAVVKGDGKTAQVTIERLVTDHLQRGRLHPRGIAVLNRDGFILARWVPTGYSETGINFSQYRAFKKSFNDRRIVQERLFFQSGDKLLIICAPLLKEKRSEGVLAIALSPSDLKEQSGLTEEDFLAIDFN